MQPEPAFAPTSKTTKPKPVRCACTTAPIYTGMQPTGAGFFVVAYKCLCGHVWGEMMTQREANIASGRGNGDVVAPGTPATPTGGSDAS